MLARKFLEYLSLIPKKMPEYIHKEDGIAIKQNINAEFMKDEEGNVVNKQNFAGSTIQWDSGKNRGIIQKIAKFQTEGTTEYVYFTDGHRALASGLNLSFHLIDPNEPIEGVPIVPSSNYWTLERISAYANDEEWIPENDKPIIPLESAKAPVLQQIITGVPVKEWAKLDKQVKTTQTVKFNVEIEIPDPSTMKILKASFDNFDEEFAAWIHQDEKILEAVMTALKTRLIKA
jgi:hypothetical protein